MTRTDLKDIVSKMEKLAVETQCFLVQDPILSPDNIMCVKFCRERDKIEKIAVSE